MTPRDVDGEVVETPALEELLNLISTNQAAGCIRHLRDARLELSRLKSRPKVSVEEAERAWHIAQAACTGVDAKHPGRPKLLAGIRAVLALCEGKT